MSFGLNSEELIYENSYNIPKYSNLLVVGAGGIGCELLKNLVMSGFKNITIVDLDTIEKSNLNRQFLFSIDCVGKCKSEMAKKTILEMRKDSELNLTALVGNIKDKTKFPEEFFKQFKLIFNALDNIDARTYVNKICIENSIPLVNSGTKGYFGTITVHLRDLTPCYNCSEKEKIKEIPICSIRSTPEKIEHCVAWAKSLFELIFCQNLGDNHLNDYEINDDMLINFQNLFYFNILNIKNALKENPNDETHNKINPIDVSLEYEINLRDLNMENDYENFNRNIHIYDEQQNANQNFLILILFISTNTLKKAIDYNLGQKFPKFDKENKDMVNFIFACSLLRAENYKIKSESRFKIKEIAGSIIPAIASTNAIIASLQTIEAIKVLTDKIDLCKNINYDIKKKIASITSKNDSKYDKCAVCSQQALRRNLINSNLIINKKHFTVDNLINLCRENLGFSNPMILLNNDVLCDLEDEEESDAIRFRTFSSFKMSSNDNRIAIDEENRRFNLRLINREDLNEGQYEYVNLHQEIPFQQVTADVIMNDENDTMIVEENNDNILFSLPISDNESLLKRKRQYDETSDVITENFTNKKQKIDIDIDLN